MKITVKRIVKATSTFTRRLTNLRFFDGVDVLILCAKNSPYLGWSWFSIDSNHRNVIKWLSIGNEILQGIIDAIDNFRG